MKIKLSIEEAGNATYVEAVIKESDLDLSVQDFSDRITKPMTATLLRQSSMDRGKSILIERPKAWVHYVASFNIRRQITHHQLSVIENGKKTVSNFETCHEYEVPEKMVQALEVLCNELPHLELELAPMESRT